MKVIKAGLPRPTRWALAFASLGFAYAILTLHPGSAVLAFGPQAGARALGTNAVRPAVMFVTGSDLGVTVVGSQFARQILVRFGFKPHMFTFGNSGSPDMNVALDVDGKLHGKTSVSGLDLFNVVVVDKPSRVPLPGVSRTFALNSIDQQFGTPLHFANGSGVPLGTLKQTITLPVALAADQYFYSLQGNGGVPPYQFQMLEQPNGRFLPQGLALNTATGLIYGKPAAPTPAGSPATFDILLTDAAGGQVTGHFLLDIQPGTITSAAVAIAGNINLNFGNQDGRDSLKLTMLLDKSLLNAKGIRSKADLSGLQISIGFGGLELPPVARPKSTTTIVKTFDAKGEIIVPQPFKTLGQKVGPPNVIDVQYRIKLDPLRGILTADFKNLKMIDAIGANFLTFDGQFDPTNRGPVVPIDVKIGLDPKTDPATGTNVYEKVDLIKFVYKRAGSLGRGTASQNANLAPAGLFLIDSVRGTEKITVVDAGANIKADRIFLTMKGLMRQPGAKPVVPKNGDQVEVFISQLNLGVFPANSFAQNGDILSFSNDDPTKGLKQLVIDNKRGTVLITTNGLDPNNKLFGVDILVAGDPQTVPVTLTIVGADPNNPTFDGQSTVTLFRKGSAILNR